MDPHDEGVLLKELTTHRLARALTERDTAANQAMELLTGFFIPAGLHEETPVDSGTRTAQGDDARPFAWHRTRLPAIFRWRRWHRI